MVPRADPAGQPTSNYPSKTLWKPNVGVMILQKQSGGEKCGSNLLYTNTAQLTDPFTPVQMASEWKGGGKWSSEKVMDYCE